MITDKCRFIVCKRTQNTHNRFHFDCPLAIEASGRRPGEGIGHGHSVFLFAAPPKTTGYRPSQARHSSIDTVSKAANCAKMAQNSIAWVKN